MEIEVANYNKQIGLTLNWTNNFKIEVTIIKNSITIKENKEGLISLANHLLNLSQDEVPINYHIHLDESNSLEFLPMN